MLALKHRQIPASLHYEQPNPQIDFVNSPFYVNAKLAEWQTDQLPRRAGVSSFGIGGTNAHAILAEAPVRKPSGPSRAYQLLLLSAKTSTALDALTANLATHLTQAGQEPLADVAYTLQVGRKAFPHRRMLVCRDQAEAAQALQAQAPERLLTGHHEGGYRPVVFMFPGQGAQHVNMGLELYESESFYREQVNRCAEILKPHLGLDIRKILYPEPARCEAAAEQLQQTHITQPALFVVEYALSRLWMEWGVQPTAMIGHSIGEYVAACIAEVFSLEDALRLVAARGKLMQGLAGGSMLAVGLAEAEITPWLGEEISLAAVNAPGLCVVSGRKAAITELQIRLESERRFCRRLQTSHAFHSHMMEPILRGFASEVGRVSANAPKLRMISNVSGKWLDAEAATSADYWVNQLRRTVRFSEGVEAVMALGQPVLLEVGPGQALQSIVNQHGAQGLSSLTQANQPTPAMAHLLGVLGQLWLAGIEVDWPQFYARERRHRLALPTYPFERQTYWVAPRRAGQALDEAPKAAGEKLPPARENSASAEASEQRAALAPVDCNSTASRPPALAMAEASEEETNALEQLLAQQLEIMAKQLALLRNPEAVELALPVDGN